MRMWMLPPEQLCRKHLLGEHGEIHKFRKSFEKGVRLGKRIHPVVQIEPVSMQCRHDELAAEMVRRGMNHKSPYIQPDLSRYTVDEINVRVDRSVAEEDLCARCEACREKIRPKKELNH